MSWTLTFYLMSLESTPGIDTSVEKIVCGWEEENKGQGIENWEWGRGSWDGSEGSRLAEQAWGLSLDPQPLSDLRVVETGPWSLLHSQPSPVVDPSSVKDLVSKSKVSQWWCTSQGAGAFQNLSLWVWEVGSVGKVLAVRAWGPGIQP